MPCVNSYFHLSSVSDQKYPSLKKKQDQPSPATHRLGVDTIVGSFLSSSLSNIASSSMVISRQDVSKGVAYPKKRYVSSFKTVAHDDKPTQRFGVPNNSVVVVKLSKAKVETTPESTLTTSPLSSKQSMASMTTPMNNTCPHSRPPASYATRLCPLLKGEGYKSRASNHEPPVIVQPNNDPSSIVHTTMHANSHPASYLSLATYQNALSSVGNARQRTRTDFSPNGLFIAPDRLKSNIGLSIRPTRAPLTELPSIVLASQTAQRSTNPNARSRPQQTKSNNNNNRDVYDYVDPYTNCPQDMLNKLSQLTKLQMETVEWEKKRRHTKKRSGTNGRDSP